MVEERRDKQCSTGWGVPVRCDDRIAQWVDLLRLRLHPDLRDRGSLLLFL